MAIFNSFLYVHQRVDHWTIESAYVASQTPRGMR